MNWKKKILVGLLVAEDEFKQKNDNDNSKSDIHYTKIYARIQKLLRLHILEKNIIN